jgi:hypothetical protein
MEHDLEADSPLCRNAFVKTCDGHVAYFLAMPSQKLAVLTFSVDGLSLRRDSPPTPFTFAFADGTEFNKEIKQGRSTRARLHRPVRALFRAPRERGRDPTVQIANVLHRVVHGGDYDRLVLSSATRTTIREPYQPRQLSATLSSAPLSSAPLRPVLTHESLLASKSDVCRTLHVDIVQVDLSLSFVLVTEHDLLAVGLALDDVARLGLGIAGVARYVLARTLDAIQRSHSSG